MDQHATPTSDSEERDFFKPDEGPVSYGTPAVPQDSSPALIEGQGVTSPHQPAPTSFTWTASEFVGHHKTTAWYMVLGLITLLVTAIVWFLAKDVFLSITVMTGVIVFGVYAGRTPREQTYTVDDSGVSVGNHHYDFKEFGSFSVIPEGPLVGIEFAPLKRFAIYATIYIQPKDEDAVLDVLSAHLPITPPRNDFTDRFMRSIKF